MKCLCGLNKYKAQMTPTIKTEWGGILTKDIRSALALRSLYGEPEETRGTELEREFTEQLDAYYSAPNSSFYDERLERKFLEQKLNHLGFTPYPKDGLVTFGASGTNKCDREIVFKNARTKAEKSQDEAFRGRQRSIGTAVIDFRQLDIIHMPMRLKDKAVFKMATTESGEYAMEGAAQIRKVFEVALPETGEIVKFAITAKPDGLFEYTPDGSRLLFEYKTKATGIVEMNGKLDFKGAQDDHLQQVTAESLVFGIDEGLLVYESTQKPAWFSDEERKNVPKTRKTWREGKPIPDLRAFYFRITERQKQALLLSLARQAQLVYDGEVPEIESEMTNKCGFCVYKEHCKSVLSAQEIEMLRSIEQAMSQSHLAGKFEHNNLVEYLSGVNADA